MGIITAKQNPKKNGWELIIYLDSCLFAAKNPAVLSIISATCNLLIMGSAPKVIFMATKIVEISPIQQVIPVLFRELSPWLTSGKPTVCYRKMADFLPLKIVDVPVRDVNGLPEAIPLYHELVIWYSMIVTSVALRQSEQDCWLWREQRV